MRLRRGECVLQVVREGGRKTKGTHTEIRSAASASKLNNQKSLHPVIFLFLIDLHAPALLLLSLDAYEPAVRGDVLCGRVRRLKGG